MLTTLLPRLQSGLYTAAATLLVLAGAYTAGSRSARRAAELAQAHQRNTSMEKAHEVKQNLDALDDAAIRSRARQWVRGPAD